MTTIASFFAGIGGLELGLEAALDAETVFQVERDTYAQRILEKHWPGVPRHDDITTLRPEQIPAADIWCGGPPCQDLSDAGTRWDRPGLDGERSGLALEWIRLITSVRPSVVVWENVAGAAVYRWVPRVRRELHRVGYASVPLRVRGVDVGARFSGARIFLVATIPEANRNGEPTGAIDEEARLLPQLAGHDWPNWREPPPGALGVAHGVPHRVDRLRCLGNAVVPQCAYIVGLRLREIMEAQA